MFKEYFLKEMKFSYLGLFVLTILLLSCSKPKKIINIDDKIQLGMTKNEVRELIGTPNDSSSYYNHERKLIYRYDYHVENFSDYHFHVIFNDSLQVVHFYYD